MDIKGFMNYPRAFKIVLPSPPGFYIRHSHQYRSILRPINRNSSHLLSFRLMSLDQLPTESGKITPKLQGWKSIEGIINQNIHIRQWKLTVGLILASYDLPEEEKNQLEICCCGCCCCCCCYKWLYCNASFCTEV